MLGLDEARAAQDAAPVAAAEDCVLKRGDCAISYNDLAKTNILTWYADRPVNMRGPSTVLIQIHTAGCKSRALGFSAEKACWALSVDNNAWCSARSNLGIRNCEAELDPNDGTVLVSRDDALERFYPFELEYWPSWQNKPNSTDGGPSVFQWSFITPQWQFTKTDRVTVQDIQISLYSGDTHQPLKIFSGCATEFTLIASP